MGGRGESVWEEVVRGCVWKGECGRVSVCVCVWKREWREGSITRRNGALKQGEERSTSSHRLQKCSDKNVNWGPLGMKRGNTHPTLRKFLTLSGS